MRKLKIFMLASLVAAAILLFAGCAGDDNGGGGGNGGDRVYYYPSVLTVNFYDDPNEPPIFTYKDESYDKTADEIAANAPVIEKEGYIFYGYYAKPTPLGATSSPGAILFGPHAVNSDAFNDELVKSPTPIEEKTVDVYAYSEAYYYRFLYEAYSVPNCFYRDEVMQSRCEWASYGGIDYYQRSMGGYDDITGMEVVGWRTSSGEMIFGFDGEPLMTPAEMYEKFRDYLVRGSEIHSSQKFIYLYPVWDQSFSVISLDYGRGGLKNGSVKVYNGDAADHAEIPGGIYFGGEYLRGWSTDKNEVKLFSGEITEDTVLYAVWVPAKELTVHVPGAEQTYKYYVLESGEILGERPEHLQKFEIDGWYTDADLTNRVSADYASLSGVAEVYTKWVQTRKQIWLNPNNGEAPVSAWIYIDPANNEIALPVWQGHELAGWYPGRDGAGDAVELTFDSVTDGATYYAKWVSTGG